MEIESSDSFNKNAKQVVERPQAAFMNIGYLIKTYDSRFMFVYGLQYFNAGMNLAFNIAFQYTYKEVYKVTPGES